MTRVTSPQNPRLREVARLAASSRDRRKAGRCVLEGEHLVDAYVVQRGAPEVLLVREDVLDRPGVAALVRATPAARLIVAPAAVFDQVASPPEGVGVLAVVPTPEAPAGPDDARFLLLLEDLQDPGNLGSILRSAAAFGVARVELSPRSAFAWSPKVLRAGQGAHFQLALHEDVDLVARARALRARGVRVLAAVAAGGKDVRAVAGRGGPVALAIGNEGAGLSAALRAEADAAVTIPMPGRVESLNAAAAAAVLLHELARATPG